MEPGPSGQEDTSLFTTVSGAVLTCAMEPGPSGQEDTARRLSGG